MRPKKKHCGIHTNNDMWGGAIDTSGKSCEACWGFYKYNKAIDDFNKWLESEECIEMVTNILIRRTMTPWACKKMAEAICSALTRG